MGVKISIAGFKKLATVIVFYIRDTGTSIGDEKKKNHASVTDRRKMAVGEYEWSWVRTSLDVIAKDLLRDSVGIEVL